MDNNDIIIGNPFEELPFRRLQDIKECSELHLGNKNLTNLINMEKFTNLQILWLNNNRFTSIQGLENNFRMRALYMHHNRITTLENASIFSFKFLETLTLNHNQLRDLHYQLKLLKYFHHLKYLDLSHNPLAEETNYRLYVIKAIPWLEILDKHRINDNERQLANELELPLSLTLNDNLIDSNQTQTNDLRNNTNTNNNILPLSLKKTSSNNNNQTILNISPSLNTLTLNFTNDKKKLIKKLINDIKKKVRKRRLCIRPYFKDYDKRKENVVREDIFLHILNLYDLVPKNNNLLDLLLECYHREPPTRSKIFGRDFNLKDINYIDYVCFCRDIEPLIGGCDPEIREERHKNEWRKRVNEVSDIVSMVTKEVEKTKKRKLIEERQKLITSVVGSLEESTKLNNDNNNNNNNSLNNINNNLNTLNENEFKITFAGRKKRLNKNKSINNNNNYDDNNDINKNKNNINNKYKLTPWEIQKLNQIITAYLSRQPSDFKLNNKILNNMLNEIKLTIGKVLKNYNNTYNKIKNIKSYKKIIKILENELWIKLNKDEAKLLSNQLYNTVQIHFRDNIFKNNNQNKKSPTRGFNKRNSKDIDNNKNEDIEYKEDKNNNKINNKKEQNNKNNKSNKNNKNKNNIILNEQLKTNVAGNAVAATLKTATVGNDRNVEGWSFSDKLAQALKFENLSKENNISDTVIFNSSNKFNNSNNRISSRMLATLRSNSTEPIFKQKYNKITNNINNKDHNNLSTTNTRLRNDSKGKNKKRSDIISFLSFQPVQQDTDSDSDSDSDTDSDSNNNLDNNVIFKNKKKIKSPNRPNKPNNETASKTNISRGLRKLKKEFNINEIDLERYSKQKLMEKKKEKKLANYTL